MNLINNFRRGHCFGSSRMRHITGGKITMFLNWAAQCLMVAYDGACSPNVSVRMAWISFGALPCRGEKYLMTARASMLLKWRPSPDVLSFSLCKKKRLAIRHMNRPLFPTTLSILWHPKVDRVKDLSAPPRTWQRITDKYRFSSPAIWCYTNTLFNFASVISHWSYAALSV